MALITSENINSFLLLVWNDTPQVCMFGITYNAWGDLFVFFKSRLSEELTELVSPPNDVARFHFKDMFISCICTTKDAEDAILQGFYENDWYIENLMCIIITVTFAWE